MFRNLNNLFYKVNRLNKSSLFRNLEVQRLTYQIQRNYFQQFLPKYECRKILLRENKPINDQYRKTALNSYEQIIEKVKDNKKKLIFFILVLLICQYTQGYEKLVYWWKFREPIKNKLMRWFFGAQNVTPSTIIEQRLHDIKISPESIDILSLQFREKEKTLKLGISRKYMSKIYKDFHLFEKEEDKRIFYVSSGYSKKRNQKPAGINLREFLKLYYESYQKLVKKNPKLTESEYLKQFLHSLETHFEGMKAWEIEFLKKRKDFKKLEQEQEKSTIVKDILKKHPLISLQNLEQEVQKLGFVGVSTKEKILILNKQLTLLLVYKNYYEDKKEMSFGSKLNRIDVKIENTNKEIEDIKKQIEDLNAILSSHYKNVTLFVNKEQV
ncbi:hypothetical protein ABPG72_003192 [Tetrahymena utriculariae]